jgi:hypothetical protein
MTAPLSPALPYGIRDIKVTPVTLADGALGTSVDLPNARTLSFEEAEDFEELRGDDRLVTKRGNGASVNWEMEAGGISLEALVVINGGALVSSGTGATAKKTYTKKVNDAKPHFRAEGQSMSEGGGDVHCILYNCVADGGVSGEFADGGFFLTSCSGTAFGSLKTTDALALYDFVYNNTATAIV